MVDSVPGLHLLWHSDLATLPHSVAWDETVAYLKARLQEVINAVSVFDKDHDGSIEMEDFKGAMTNYGQKLTEDQASKMWKDADTNSDGKLSVQEFAVFLCAM